MTGDQVAVDTDPGALLDTEHHLAGADLVIGHHLGECHLTEHLRHHLDE